MQTIKRLCIPGLGQGCLGYRANRQEKIMHDHTNLRAFELADQAVLFIYRTTRKFPKEELYGLVS